jgi:hypothetical protein
MYLYLCNPDNDMAIGNNSPYYQPPASARQMAADMTALPGMGGPVRGKYGSRVRKGIG